MRQAADFGKNAMPQSFRKHGTLIAQVVVMRKLIVQVDCPLCRPVVHVECVCVCICMSAFLRVCMCACMCMHVCVVYIICMYV